MGYDYALVHLKYTIPPAIALTVLARPLLTRLDVYKIFFLITIAVVATTPWDSYLIRTSIWSYPSDVIVGPKLFSIPIEEVFFFVVQTYNTSLLYLLFSKPTFHPSYLRFEEKKDVWKYVRLAGQGILALVLRKGYKLFAAEKEGVYMGLILMWATPFIMLLWSLAYQFIIGLPWTNTFLPIAIPTIYLWIVDTLALRRGTWVIEGGTKLGVHLWPHLEVEEAVFFLLTNVLIVFGLVAFDNAVAVLHSFPFHFPTVSALPSPLSLINALLLPARAYDEDRIHGLKQAAERLRNKSRSFYLASGVFPDRLRIDLVILYSFCRAADDMVDTATTPAEARRWIRKLTTFVDLSYKSKGKESRDANMGEIALYVAQNFPRSVHSALLQLPTQRLSSAPLYDLLKGFETDLKFQGSVKGNNEVKFPIKTQRDLDTYSARVAGTVAELCLELVCFHYPQALPTASREDVFAAGRQMGIALQYINIARDLTVDARLQRIYVPSVWLGEEGMTSDEAIKVLCILSSKPKEDAQDAYFSQKFKRLRHKLLERAFDLYTQSRGAVEVLPVEVRGPMRVAVESYMEIGRALQKRESLGSNGRATVPLTTRIAVAWRALNNAQR
ncbi:hypothetical protein AAFC00_004101 [Neodothiora populina]|uniref:Bifunctional lycopene cyclase/phytoene synthase n=1 Tax=Neodothiora populina TaxID=2781224 RepID=A0ABR3PIM1_9PEZI